MSSVDEQAKAIFEELVDVQSHDDRLTYLDRACGDNAELRAEVESLVQAWDKVGDFLARPARVAVDKSAIAKLTGTQVGPYTLLRQLGRGAMGVVYEAEQTPLGRRVALKILPFAALLNQNQLERFNTEVTAAARLQHSGIVTIYSVGCERGIHYYSMQLIEGPSLADVIAELRQHRPLSEEQGTADSHVLTRDEDGGHYRAVARIGREAAKALQYAHENGVLHRDIKPSNLLVDKTGHVWIADFGLARVEDESQLTRSGDILGTLRYMSPEQARGERVDARSDVYSLGATLYELTTLQPAYDSEDKRDIIKQVLAGNPIAPHTVDSRIPQPLSLVISKAMARLDERCQSAQGLAEDLRRFLDGEPVSAKPPTFLRRSKAWVRRHRLVSATLVGLVILVLLLPFTTHHFFGRATDSPAKGDDNSVSNTPKVAVAAAALADPTGLVVSAATEDSITLEWTSGGGTTAGFIVVYLEGTNYPRSNLRGATIVDVGNQEYCTVDGLKTEQIYSFRVCAVDSNGKRSSGVTVQGTTLSAPPVLYEVLDNYAPFVDESVYLGLGATVIQPDGKAIVTAGAQPNVNPNLYTGGEHFVGRMSADGSVDTTFRGVGFHQMDILNDGTATLDYPRNPIVVPDGTILVSGTLGGLTPWKTTAWYIVKYNEDGSLDTTFGGGDGIVVDSVPDVLGATGFTITARPNGKIILAGSTQSSGERNMCTLAQYNEDGSPDTSFGADENGRAFFLPDGTVFFGAAWGGKCKGFTLLTDGRIAVTGLTQTPDYHWLSSVIVFNENGSVDTSFGNEGHAFVDIWPESGADRTGWEIPWGIIEQPDGKILIYGSRAGWVDETMIYPYMRTMARFRADGSIDENFGTDGIVAEKHPDYLHEMFHAVDVQSDGKLVVLGWASQVYLQWGRLTIERFHSDGSPDMSFDGTGRIEFGAVGSEMTAKGIRPMDDGSIVIGGIHRDLEPGGLSRGLLLTLFPMP